MMKRRKKLLVLIIAVIVAAFSYFGEDNFDTYKNQQSGNDVIDTSNLNENADILKVHYLDVGQGDCTVIELTNGEIMMIDAGDNGYEDEVFEFLSSIGVKKIDYLVATHPHSDHIGGMEEVIAEYDIGKIYMSDAFHTSKTFENMLLEIEKKNLSINKAKAGKTIFDFGDLSAEFLSPVSDTYDNLNNYSAAVMLRYKNESFLFCGDIEKEVEDELLENNTDISCDVLKIPHHGSSTSSSAKFLEKADFDTAVISCGLDNEYGHPHQSVLNRINKITDIILRTDESGDITLLSDGEETKAVTEY